ncbi:hypothetical protein [Spiroplasma endosymbiont of Nebria brevicollis]|uniref:hypothetical protein n=1 Tax=Spiroplasma endosymbiont of Nebria brevicollis TaxID=3066284 RepID=UPI00313AF2FB
MKIQQELLINDIWIINYSVPYKNTLLRPFIITNIINNIVYGIPLTSFNKKRYMPNLGDIIFQEQYLIKKSIIKPYQLLIHIRKNNFVNKIGTVNPELVKNINNKIDNNISKYLSMKNINSIMREYLIERQNQKIEVLQQENNVLKTDLLNTKFQLQLRQKDKELFLKTTNDKVIILEQKIENLEKKLTLKNKKC